MLMTDRKHIQTFTRAGKATLTLSSRKSGAHFTYKFDQINDKDGEPSSKYFVSLLSGPNNTSDFKYLGLMASGEFRLTAKSCASETAPSVKAVRFFCEKVLQVEQGPLPVDLEVRHDGRCGRCKRVLTVEASIDSGIGPECATKLGLPYEKRGKK